MKLPYIQRGRINHTLPQDTTNTMSFTVHDGTQDSPFTHITRTYCDGVAAKRMGFFDIPLLKYEEFNPQEALY